jgi:hypothetical protein
VLEENAFGIQSRPHVCPDDRGGLLKRHFPGRLADLFQVGQQDVAEGAILRVDSNEGPCFSLQVSFQFGVKPEACCGFFVSTLFHGSS